MKLSFYGAAGSVTGSCIIVEHSLGKFMVDCGMFQGGKALRELNENPYPFNPAEIDFLILTHAHIDHSGMIPKLVKHGYKNPIYATKPTVDLCEIMLADSAHIQESDAEYDTRKNKRKGLPPVEPIYTMQDAEDAMKLFKKTEYGVTFSPFENIKLRYNDSGHMLGSSAVEVWVTENGKTEKIVFSGDLGNRDKPLLKDPTIITEADHLVLESTYGGRNHTYVDATAQFLDIVRSTLAVGGTLVIPAFAVGRTQDILYVLNHFKENNLLGADNDVRVFVDSPLAVKATQVFKENYYVLDEESQQLIQSGDDPLVFKNLNFSVTTDDSRALNTDEGSKIIISASGMCDAGRIRHHIKHNAYKENCTILFVGYQAEGSLGRLLLDGEKDIKLFGERIAVKARIAQIDYFSGHADHNMLVEWAGHFKNLKNVILVHGEDDSLNALKKGLEETNGQNVHIAQYLSTIDLSTQGELTTLDAGKPIGVFEGSSEQESQKETAPQTESSPRIVFKGQKMPKQEEYISSLASMAQDIANRLKDKENLLKANSFDKIKLFLECVNDILSQE
ncbi:MAG: MBL fold metallo-hydrolase [Eubacteriaceae bacterium]|nr:MBL fold metallo-hydrolase [Eubacteriaceae bacterium]